MVASGKECSRRRTACRSQKKARLGLAISLVLLLGGRLSAQVLQITDLDVAAWPTITMQIQVRSAHPVSAAKKALQDPELAIYELYIDQEQEVPQIDLQALDPADLRLNLVLVLDRTRSVSKHDFNLAREQAHELLLQLDSQDRSALYSIQGQPLLLGDISSDHRAQALKVSGLKHTGERTRLYDTLFSAIYTARSMATDALEKGAQKTAVVLYTDGRDEGSYLNENDCFELTELGRKLEIPVYVFTQQSRFTETKADRGAETSVTSTNLRLLERLALKTGGQVWSLPREEAQRKRAFAIIQSGNNQNYRLRFTSAASQADVWPGDQITLRTRLQSNAGVFRSVSRYRVPPGPWIRNRYGRSAFLIYLIVAALVLSFALLVGLLLFLLYRTRTAAQAATPTKQSADEADLANDEPQKPNIQDYLDKPTQFLGSDTTAIDDDFRPGPSESVRSDRNFAAVHPAAVLMDDERRLYMREYNYRLLQMALREAGLYQTARLVLLNHPESPHGRDYDLFLENTAIGSGRWANIPLHDNTVSPIHARIKRVNQSWVLYDLLSAGGVYVNDRKLLRPRGLQNGDLIRIGRSQLRFLGQ
ncbi:MAG: FHA domain-containing protein [Leptospiraceae bacterium]|nr:FHA domain-containing protein [Leptospiraceae bacterium]